MRRLVKLGVAGCCCAIAAASAYGIAGSAGHDVARQPFAEPATPSRDAPFTARTPVRSGNPLWAIPLEQLSETRERPIFSPARRPPPTDTPPPAVAAAPVVQEQSAPERPQLSLVGTVVNGDRGLAIFLDPGSRTPLRIRTGADYQGWTLRHVEARSATLQKGDDLAVLYFASPSGPSANPVATTVADVPSTPTAPPLAQAGPPFLSPESRLLRMHQRQRSGRRPL
ncbi:hypothetical protein SSBR45G_37490 [Bradyrhizobium sp. SSBR45G]|uniref:hypothetical protein n=1 Tax=unclassified Bradyrhizobium TaxID=2631580 RepID=UPI002342B54F|nr:MULTISPECIES: hypothetical protein [unclassified Bradyrhizobium]GLH78840.1 hypothetical protein SSBR45G_37490 [Bradyrhizobium sp. SSBR45G]GLH86446.1 hypothetical protein SSBR45R_39060 [Bradyrhizobium sp. SSBR45R]